jgi:hypothetical protein
VEKMIYFPLKNMKDSLAEVELETITGIKGAMFPV